MSKKILGWAAVVLLLGGAFYLVQAQSTAPKTTSALPHLTSAQYANARANDVYVMLIGRSSCMPCKRAEQMVFVELAQRYKGAKNIHVVKVDLDEDKNTPAGTQKIEKIFHVTASPTMLVVQGGNTLWRWLDQQGEDRGFLKDDAGQVKAQIIGVVDPLK